MALLVPQSNSVTVGASAVVILDQVQDGQVDELVITNTSTGGQVIYLSDGQLAVVGSGITIYPTGTHSEARDFGFTPSALEWTAIASAGGGSVSVRRRLKE